MSSGNWCQPEKSTSTGINFSSNVKQPAVTWNVPSKNDAWSNAKANAELLTPNLVSNNLPSSGYSVANGTHDDATKSDNGMNGLSNALTVAENEAVPEELPSNLKDLVSKWEKMKSRQWIIFESF